jgi:PadR family transcriptional regulator, regulatory protein PadR
MADDRFLYAGLIRLYVLHHAVKEPVYGLAMIEELARHGYKLSAGTLYPILHGLEERGYLTSTEERSGSVARRVYRATSLGAEALAAAKLKVRELFWRAIRGRHSGRKLSAEEMKEIGSLGQSSQSMLGGPF